MAEQRTPQLRINPITCRAHGICAELLPELIDLDEWGYPILVDRAVRRSILADAKEAVSACPTLALSLTRPRSWPPGSQPPVGHPAGWEHGGRGDAREPAESTDFTGFSPGSYLGHRNAVPPGSRFRHTGFDS
ncbi:MAG TPA: ferredoxin [Amycolatopsis sp.]|nr:ferredoxin [Amycolatopsis sp.]